jgi:DNA invertase Pin-like site-specific DNA recombinase
MRELRAAVYVRMSTDDQKDSPERQRAAVLPYCERHGYKVVAEYEDLGIAGDEFAKRRGLQRLLADATAGKFEVIVSDEPSRLSRQDFFDFVSTVARPLKQAGVRLDTVSAGPLGWDDLAQQLMLLIHQDKASGESKALARRVLAGCALHAQKGTPLGGAAAYGYKTEYVIVEEPGKAPRHRPLRLVADGVKAKVVRWLFEQYATRDISLQGLADELNRRGMEPPGKKGHRKHKAKWVRVTVRVILTNAKYTGAMLWNRVTQAKHYHLAEGRPVHRPDRRNGRTYVKVANVCDEWIVIPDKHEALVTQELFERVQEKLGGNRGRKTVAVGGHLLSGLLTCAHCGRTLQASTQRGTVYFRCRKADDSDRPTCGYGAVREAAVVRAVLAKLQSGLLGGERLEAFRAEARRQLQAERGDVYDPPAMRERLDAIDRDLATAGKRLASIPEDVQDVLVTEVRRLKQEKADLRTRLDHGPPPDPMADIDKMIAEAEAVVWDMKNAAAAGDPAALRETFRRLISRIEICWDHRLVRKFMRHTVIGGTVYLHVGQMADLLTTISRGCR